jgi:hypothetical protein
MSGNGDVTKDAGDTLHLIGFRIDRHLPEPDFYVLTTGLNGDVPLLYGGQIILFQQPGAAQDALRQAFGELFDTAFERAHAVEAVQWALGAVMSKSMFVPRSAPQHA